MPGELFHNEWERRKLRNKVHLTIGGAFQRQRKEDDPSSVAIRLEQRDLREAVRQGRAGYLILFVVDASGSMAARQRMVAAKGAVLSLLLDAYQRRDQVGMIAFRGERADLVLPPTRSVDLAERHLRELPTGGRTPLAHGLSLALETLAHTSLDEVLPFLVIVSDGRANVTLSGEEPVAESRRIAAEIAERRVPALVVDCESGHIRLGLAVELARALTATYHRLEDLTADSLSRVVQTALPHHRGPAAE